MNQAEYQSLEEVKERGTPAFPVGFYLGKYMGPGSILHYHWHRHWQWIYMVRGEGIIAIDDVKYAVAAGESVFIGAGQLHSGITESAGGCVHLSIVFDPEGVYGAPLAVRQYYEGFKLGRCRLQTKYGNEDEGGKRINASLKGILQCVSRVRPGYEVSIVAKLQAILGYALRYGLYESGAAGDGRTCDRGGDKIALALDYIHRHYAEKLTLKAIADAAGLSVQKLCKDFKAMTGTTAVEYLNTYRIYEAGLLLREGNCAVAKVAQLCGFETPSYFIKLFKRIKGTTPTNFKTGFGDVALPDFVVSSSAAVPE